MTAIIFLALLSILVIGPWSTEACIKSSMYYRSQFRSQSHVFVPEEYQPTKPERSLDASGPLEPQDFQMSIPSPRLVRADGPNLQFANEEARWMTKGCRDRLLKLVTQVQNAWPTNDMALRVTRAWMKPPPTALRPNRVVIKRGDNEAGSSSSNRHKQPLQMSMVDNYNNYKTKQQKVYYNYRSANSLGVKVASPGSSILIQKPRINNTGVDNFLRVPDPQLRLPYSDSRYRGQERYVSRQDNSVNRLDRNKPATEEQYASSVEFYEALPFLKHMMMEEFHYAGRAVDITLVNTKGSNTRSPFDSIYPAKLAQMAYYGALFDWCFFSRLGHVHCSVKPDSIITSQWFGCFPHDAKALRSDLTTIFLKDVQVGDELLTYDLHSKSFQKTNVISFLHRDEHQFSHWIQLMFRKQPNDPQLSTLKLTANHLIYRRVGTLVSSVFAGDIQPGDSIAGSLNNTDPFCEVVQTERINGTLTSPPYGVYAPLTTSGNLIIDGVLVSCYAHFKVEWLMKLVNLPLLAEFYLRPLIGDFISSSKDHPLGLHWYVEWLFQIGRKLLPDYMFFNHV